MKKSEKTSERKSSLLSQEAEESPTDKSQRLVEQSLLQEASLTSKPLQKQFSLGLNPNLYLDDYYHDQKNITI